MMMVWYGTIRLTNTLTILISIFSRNLNRTDSNPCTFEVQFKKDGKIGLWNATQTRDITNLQDVCSIEDISPKEAPLEDRKDLDLPGTSDIPSDNTSSVPTDLLPEVTCENQNSESSTSSHPISNKPSNKDCVKIVNVEESHAVDQSPAIQLAYPISKKQNLPKLTLYELIIGHNYPQVKFNF
ncbi:11535_t:CDS:2 [Funneliformis mosseae]|uniref:11535_t:CDS:1 n=1 Tax=Funneliformis mosseae TaxID=27381 RepID=A0A9N9ATN3_FUNMO|nr:11535_t:CDS:2 [Funneliformis mosseae]